MTAMEVTLPLTAYYRHPRLYDLHFLLPPFGRWLRRNHDSILVELPPLEQGKILEVGCSTGTLTRKLAEHYPGCSILSIDRSEGMCQSARARGNPPNTTFQPIDFWDLEGAFDLIIAAGSWEFFDLVPSLEKLEQLLAFGGRVLINDVGPSTFGTMHHTLFSRALGTRVWLHDPREFAEAFLRRGFHCGWKRVNRLEGSYTLWAGRSRT